MRVAKGLTDSPTVICKLATIVPPSGESTEEELLRRLQQIKEGPPPQSSDENRGMLGFGRWLVDDGNFVIVNVNQKIIRKCHN